MEYDPTSCEVQENPYPAYRWLRDEAPLYHNEKMGFWALSRFQDVWDATLDWQSFTSTYGQTLEKVDSPLPMMISMGPPVHTRVRALVAKAFTPRRVAEMEPIVRRITRERLAALEPGMQIDLFEQLASSMPMDVISTMLGVPPEHRTRVRHLTNQLMHREPGELDVSQRFAEFGGQLYAYFRDLIAEMNLDLALVGPPPEPERPASWLGTFQAGGRIVGDIVSPASDEREWDALKP